MGSGSPSRHTPWTHLRCHIGRIHTFGLKVIDNESTTRTSALADSPRIEGKGCIHYRKHDYKFPQEHHVSVRCTRIHPRSNIVLCTFSAGWGLCLECMCVQKWVWVFQSGCLTFDAKAAHSPLIAGWRLWTRGHCQRVSSCIDILGHLLEGGIDPSSSASPSHYDRMGLG
jgi:hypothetical protein